MKNNFEVVDHEGNLVWAFSMQPDGDKWKAATTNLGGLLFTLPDFKDESEPLLLNTIERWCIINGLTIRQSISLSKGGGSKYDDYYRINGERVYLCYKWMVQARFKRRRSGRVRIHNFEVHSESREGAKDMASRQFKGAALLEILSLTPCGFGLCYWKDRANFPNIDPGIISRLQMPENL